MGKNTLRLDTRELQSLLLKLDSLGGDVEKITEKALMEAAEKITKDTLEGAQKPQLPRGGKYSSGDTEKSVVKSPQVEWEGMTASIGVGFDYSKPGAAGYLIKGRHYVGNGKDGPYTNHMDFAQQLNMVYTGKSYMKSVKEKMRDTVGKEIVKKMEGR